MEQDSQVEVADSRTLLGRFGHIPKDAQRAQITVKTPDGTETRHVKWVSGRWMGRNTTHNLKCRAAALSSLSKTGELLGVLENAKKSATADLEAARKKLKKQLRVDEREALRLERNRLKDAVRTLTSDIEYAEGMVAGFKRTLEAFPKMVEYIPC